jgi:hypothetical protein
MERIEDEVLRDLHITASTEGGMIRVVADALEDAAIDEEAFLDRIAVESGGLRGLFGKLGSLWSRAKQLLGGSPQAPPTLRSAVIPPAPPPQLGAGSPSTPRPPTAEQKQLANWLTGGLVPRPPSIGDAPPTLRSRTDPGASQTRRRRRETTDAFEAVLEAAVEMDLFEASTPVLAGMALRRAIPQVAGMPGPVRRQMIAAVANAMRVLARRSAPHHVRALPGLLRGIHRARKRRRLPLRGLTRAVPRQAAQLASQPDLIARFTAAGPPSRNGS